MKLLSMLFPEKCMFCGRIISSKDYKETGCCTHCLQENHCVRQNEYTQPDILPHVFELYCPLVYVGQVKNALIRYKFQGENWLANPLSVYLHQYLQSVDGYAYCDYITAVPVSQHRLGERGYNQAELIAQKLSLYTGIPYKQFIMRENTTGTAQTGKMNRSQRLNCKRFQPIEAICIQDHPGILLIDDILTTGSTIKECTEILLEMGAGFVKAAVLASGRRDIGGDMILEHVTFVINEQDRIGIVGTNGAGKTTLIRILIEEYKETEGTFFVHSKAKGRIGYLPQNTGLESTYTVLEEFMLPFRSLMEMEIAQSQIEKQMESCGSDEIEVLSTRLAALYDRYQAQGGLTYRNRVQSILKGLGFDEDSWNLAINSLSGGQKTRLALGRLLLSNPDVLILDEPTNHLDRDSIEWLEQELKNYKGTLLLISHDRSFLDTVTSKTMLIENGTAFLYHASYSKYAQLRNDDLVYQERMWKQQQKEIARIEAFIENQRKWNRERNIIAAESRMKQLDRMVMIDKPRSPKDPPPISFEIDVPGGKDVLSVQNLSFSYPNRPLFQNVSFDVYKGERVFITGPNGCGKSTFLKVLTNMLSSQEKMYVSGTYKIGIHTAYSYYAQDLSGLNPNNTVFDEIYDHANQNKNAVELISVTKIRSALAAFGFKGEEVFKEIHTLSGGEKSRLSLLKIAYERKPFLILDEPTNHLDIATRETLEAALSQYQGTLLVVSHDRYFTDQLATRRIDISSFVPKAQPETGKDSESSGAQDYKAEKERRAKQRKIQNERIRLENFIEKSMEDLRILEEKLQDSQILSNYTLLSELYTQKEAMEAEIFNAMSTLESLEDFISN